MPYNDVEDTVKEIRYNKHDEAEQAFSAVVLICTKLRSRLDDDTVDTLCFLRAYYQSHK